MKVSISKKPSSAFAVLPVAQSTESSSKKAKIKIASRKSLGVLGKDWATRIESEASRVDFRAAPSSGFELSGVKKRAERVKVVGLGGRGKISHSLWLERWRTVAAKAIQSAKSNKFETASFLLSDVPESELAEVAKSIVEGSYLSQYAFTEFKGEKKKASKKVAVEIVTAAKLSLADLKRASEACEAACFSRDLVNCPPSDMLPKDLLKEAKDISKKKGSRISLKSFNRAALKKMKAGSLLSVARGSDSEPYLIHLTYRPAKKLKSSKKIVLVGKGITFDSGGLSIKPAASMMDMKVDMAGAACVLGVMKALSSGKFNLKHEVHALVPTCENLIDDDSMKPGDVAKAMNGKTIEILNTDAEGRLILADALCYSKKLKPDVIVDYATLTGACVAALGTSYAGLFSDDEGLSESLLESGKKTGELLWRLPLAPEYEQTIKSKVADIQNIGPGGPGAITAALFLKHFVPEGPAWAHIDIAGPASIAKATDYIPAGGSGFAVRLTLDYLGNL